jgi:hypothetical protein
VRALPRHTTDGPASPRLPAHERALLAYRSGAVHIYNMTGVCMWFFTEYAHLHYLYSKMVSGLVVFLWNFAAKKWVLFHR